jgi:hypothetical protein
MKEVILVMILLLVLVVSGIMAFKNNYEEEVFICDNFDAGIGEYTLGDLLYQGPVQEGYDEFIFRLTGEHKEIN